jgi:hypothetical protein
MTYRSEKDALFAQVHALQGELESYRAQNPCRACRYPNPASAQFCGQCAIRLSPLRHLPIQHRPLWQVALLSLLTFSLYNIYLVWRWSRDLARLGPEKRNSKRVLWVSIVSLGLAPMVYECLMARDVEEQLHSYGYGPARPNRLQAYIITLNICAFLLSVIPFGAIVGIPLGVTATVMLQQQLNRFASPS